MAITNLLLSGRAALPHGTGLQLLAGHAGVSREAAYKALRYEREHGIAS